MATTKKVAKKATTPKKAVKKTTTKKATTKTTKKEIVRDKKGRIVKGTGQNTNKNGTAGRPPSINKETLAKLEMAFANSFTDDEACLYADIHPSTLYRYIEKHPEFSEKKEMLKKKPNLKAKMNWLREINGGNYQASKERLERKAKDEFSTKQEVEQETHQINYSKTEWSEKTPEELKKAQEELLK